MTESIPPGTLDMLILETLERLEDEHGFEIADAVQRTSAGVLQILRPAPE